MSYITQWRVWTELYAKENMNATSFTENALDTTSTLYNEGYEHNVIHNAEDQ